MGDKLDAVCGECIVTERVAFVLFMSSFKAL